ncbi:MAG: Maf-like protein [Anaerolineae bacterium]|nr:Maf-like protein [Anaerolineae bacterium]
MNGIHSSARRPFVLASASPRRRELLGIAGFMFSTVRIEADESPLPEEVPRDYVIRVSTLKAMAAPPQLQGNPGDHRGGYSSGGPGEAIG